MLGLLAGGARGTRTHSERGGVEERLRARHEARVRRGDGEPPLAVINVDARSVVRIRESRRVEARGLGCVARGCESFSRSRFPNNEKSAPLTKVIVSRDTVYPRRSVLAVVCVETGRKKFRALACSSPPRAQTVSLDPSSHGLARRHLSCVANGLLTVPRPRLLPR